MQKARQKCLPRHRTWIILESSSGACFLLHLQRSTEMGKSGPRINGDLLCSVQLAACSVQRVRARPSPLPSRARTDELRQDGVDQPPAAPQDTPPRLPLTSTPRMQETDNKQMITCASSCSCPCAADCAVVAPVPAPVSPLALVPRSQGIRRQNVVA